MGIVIDIVVIALIILMVILGIKRGFVKSLFGLLSIVIALAAAIFLTAPVADAVAANTEWDEDLRQELATSIADTLPNSEASVRYVYVDGSEDPVLVYIPEDTNEQVEFSEILSSGGLWSIMPKSWLNEAATDMLNAQAEADEIDLDDPTNFVSFREVTSQALVNVIYSAAGFIVVFIAARVLIWLLLLLLRKVVRNVYIAYFVDKMLGGIIGLALGLVIVLVLLTILQLMGEMSFMAEVNELLESTTITRLLMENNFLYELIAENVDLSGLLGGTGGAEEELIQ